MVKHYTDYIVLGCNSMVLWFTETQDVDMFLSRLSLSVTILVGIVTVGIRLYNLIKKKNENN